VEGRSHCFDIGTAQGSFPVELALAHPHLAGGGFDLPAVGPVFSRYVASHGLSQRLRFVPGDFFVDDLPRADVLEAGFTNCRVVPLTGPHSAVIAEK
jgi:O-methyltransferase domain